MTTLNTLTEQASDLGKEAKESIASMGRSAERKFDEAREGTGEALHAAASSVRKTGRQGSQALDDLTGGAADRLDATASYVEDHGLSDVIRSLRKFARWHLTESLVAAAVAGLFAGVALCRATHSSERALKET